MNKLLFSILALVLVFTHGFIITSCNRRNGGSSVTGGDPNEIIITGLEGKSGRLTLSIYSGVNDLIISGNANINNDSAVKVEFINRNGQPWTESGSYLIRLSIDNDDFYYTNGRSRAQLNINGTETSEQLFEKIPKYRISGRVSTIPFNLFVSREDL